MENPCGSPGCWVISTLIRSSSSCVVWVVTVTGRSVGDIKGYTAGLPPPSLPSCLTLSLGTCKWHSFCCPSKRWLLEGDCTPTFHPSPKSTKKIQRVGDFCFPHLRMTLLLAISKFGEENSLKMENGTRASFVACDPGSSIDKVLHSEGPQSWGPLR